MFMETGTYRLQARGISITLNEWYGNAFPRMFDMLPCFPFHIVPFTTSFVLLCLYLTIVIVIVVSLAGIFACVPQICHCGPMWWCVFLSLCVYSNILNVCMYVFIYTAVQDV